MPSLRVNETISSQSDRKEKLLRTARMATESSGGSIMVFAITASCHRDMSRVTGGGQVRKR